MSGFRFRRKEVKLENLLGIRARLVLLALILVAPLMLERTRSLEDARNKQIVPTPNSPASRSKVPTANATSFHRSKPY